MRRLIRLLTIIIIAILMLAVGISTYTVLSTAGSISVVYDGTEISDEEAEELKSISPQCIVVLGCAAWSEHEPSPMLEDRLDTAIELYRKGVAPKLLLSGDNGIPEYSEPECMYQYAISKGIPEEDIFLDYAGFSTYDSVFRAKEVFCADRMIIVTQKYHLYRALSIADSLGIDALGAASEQRTYNGRYFREAREVLARDKDFLKCIFKPDPVFLGEKIPVDGDGRVTHLK